MVISYQGGNYFKIQSGDFTLLIDPDNARSFKGANVVLNTVKPSIVAFPSDEEGLVWIENQGEYEVKGARIEGWTLRGDGEEEKTAYVFEIEGIRTATLGRISKEPPPEVLENFEGLDILILPGGGGDYLSPEGAVKLIRKMEPKIFIPSLIAETPKKFFAALGETATPMEKLVIKKKDLEEGTKLVYLKA